MAPLLAASRLASRKPRSGLYCQVVVAHPSNKNLYIFSKKFYYFHTDRLKILIFSRVAPYPVFHQDISVETL